MTPPTSFTTPSLRRVGLLSRPLPRRPLPRPFVHGSANDKIPPSRPSNSGENQSPRTLPSGS